MSITYINHFFVNLAEWWAPKHELEIDRKFGSPRYLEHGESLLERATCHTLNNIKL